MKRVVYGLIALFSALLLVRASSYGAMGRFVAHTGDRLIGSAGVALLTLVLFVVSFRLLVPAPVRRWLLSFPFDREPAAQAQVVRAPRRPRAPRQQLVVVTGADLQGLGLQGLVAALSGGMEQEAPVARQIAPRRAEPAPVVEPEVVLAPPQRMRLDDVRGALKQLGYKSYEYEPLVGRMDPTVSFETLVKGALKKLNEKRN